MKSKMKKTLAGSLSAVLFAASVLGSGMTAFAASGTDSSGKFYLEDFTASTGSKTYNGYAITGTAEDEEEVTIPEKLTKDGVEKTVYSLGVAGSAHSPFSTSTKQINLPNTIVAISERAFYNLPELDEITAGTQYTTNESGGGRGFYRSDLATLYKYYETNAKTDFKLPDATTTVYAMDHAAFNTLDLNNVTTSASHSFAGTTANVLKLHDLSVGGVDAGEDNILFGMLAGKFEVTGPDTSSLSTDGISLVKTTGNTKKLIKLSVGAENSIEDQNYFSQFNAISPYAFTSIAQYNDLNNKGMLPENLVRNVVFSFYNQEDGVFIVNGETGFCYNYGLRVPNAVSKDAKAYAENFNDGNKTEITEDTAKKIEALMFLGVPNDGTGLFKQTFGVSYDESWNENGVRENGNAGLNTVSALLYQLVSGREITDVFGVNEDGIFTADKVQAYREALENALKDYAKYTEMGIRFYVTDSGYQNVIVPELKPVISKTDAATGEELPGAGLTVTDADGKEVDKWTSTDTPHIIDKILPDGTYTLTEVTAPDGYEKAESINFTVKNGKVAGGRVVMQDKPEETKTEVSISKVDAAGGKEIAGAELTITDESGQTVDSWVSSVDVPHTVTLPDGKYTLTEITAPYGYEKAESITFTVKNGKVDGGNTVTMKDEAKKATPSNVATPSTLISKQDITTKGEIIGAKLSVTDASGKTVETWTSDGSVHKIQLPDGTYTLTEVTAPNGYRKAESVPFTVKDGKTSGGKVVMYDVPQLRISKQNIAGTKEIPGAELCVKDSSGTVIEKWTSESSPHMIENLPDGTYTLTENRAPSGYKKAETIEFTVKNGLVNGKAVVVMYDEEKSSSGGGHSSSGGSSSGNSGYHSVDNKTTNNTSSTTETPSVTNSTITTTTDTTNGQPTIQQNKTTGNLVTDQHAPVPKTGESRLPEIALSAALVLSLAGIWISRRRKSLV